MEPKHALAWNVTLRVACCAVARSCTALNARLLATSAGLLARRGSVGRARLRCTTKETHASRTCCAHLHVPRRNKRGGWNREGSIAAVAVCMAPSECCRTLNATLCRRSAQRVCTLMKCLCCGQDVATSSWLHAVLHPCSHLYVETS